MPSAATFRPAEGIEPFKRFPLIGPLFPDEPIWSGCARLKQRYPRLKDKEITHWVTGGLTSWASFVNIKLPTNARILARTFGYGHQWRKLIWNHTFWPWLAAFLPAADRKDHERFLYSDEGIKYLPWSIKIQRGALDYHAIAERLRACRQCAIDDEEKYGEIYWHRLHQFRGIHTCAAHGCRLVETRVDVSWDHKYYVPLTWSLISNGGKCPPPEVLQLFLAKKIGTFTKMCRPVAADFFSMGDRLRNAMWHAGLPVLCARNASVVHARLIEVFGRRDMSSASDDWQTVLFGPNGPLPLPIHTLMICRLLGVSPGRAFNLKWRAAEYGDHNYNCFSRQAVPRRHFVTAYAQQYPRSLSPGNPHVCRTCRANLQRA